MVSPLIATRAYAAIQGTGLGQTAGAGGAAPTADFGSMLRNAVGDVVQSSRAAETQMAQHAAGRGNLIDAVTAISSAEASLETVMAIRDQVITAYQEIMRMPI